VPLHRRDDRTAEIVCDTRGAARLPAPRQTSLARIAAPVFVDALSCSTNLVSASFSSAVRTCAFSG